MRKALLASICLLAFSAPASASNIYCSGYQFGMQARILVTLDINDGKLRACEISLDNSKAISLLKQRYCNNDNYCTFTGHVARRIGNIYIIDSIKGPGKE